METDNKLKQQSSEEIFAEDYDNNKKAGNLSKKEQNQNQNDLIQSSIEFDKHQLFFHSQPNIMSYDTVTIKNTGKTCIYYQWEKNSSSFQLEDKKSDGMENNVPSRELSYYGMYLRKFLEEIDSPKKNDESFINERADAAEIEYEERRRDGKSVFEAQECAMAVLVAGISEDI